MPRISAGNTRWRKVLIKLGSVGSVIPDDGRIGNCRVNR